MSWSLINHLDLEHFLDTTRAPTVLLREDAESIQLQAVETDVLLHVIEIAAPVIDNPATWEFADSEAYNAAVDRRQSEIDSKLGMLTSLIASYLESKGRDLTVNAIARHGEALQSTPWPQTWISENAQVAPPAPSTPETTTPPAETTPPSPETPASPTPA